mgnify:CR=1 FL=1
MNKEEAKKQFEYWTDKLSLKHSFDFDTAWSFARYSELKKTLNNPVGFKKSKYTEEDFKKGIKKVESIINKNERSIPKEDIDKFNPLKHSFGKGLYVREVFNPAGELIITKIHKYDHPYFLLSGEMSILDKEGEKRIVAPHYGITKANTKRIIFAHTDCIFVTVHATNKTDLDEIEKEIILKDFSKDKT